MAITSAARVDEARNAIEHVTGPANIFVVAVAMGYADLDNLQKAFAEVVDREDAALIVLPFSSGDKEPRRPGSSLFGRTVTPIEDGAALKSGAVYLASDDQAIKLSKGTFESRRIRGQDNRLLTACDQLFRSVAAFAKDRSAAILSAHDETMIPALGLEAITAAGGLTLALAEQGANGEERPPTLDGVDYRGAASQLADQLSDFMKINRRQRLPNSATGDRALKEVLPEICEILKAQTDQDFLHYKTPTLLRRIRRRMQVLHVPLPGDYVKTLREQPSEAQALFRELLIGVTGFFRDQHAFEALAETVIGPMLRDRGADDVVRIWVAGCGTGEEAYSIAMLVLEALEGQKARPKVRIFATDIDGRALAVARRGLYSSRVTEQVGSARLERFFERSGGRYRVKKEVRDCCLFSHHSLISDPPFSRVDLISCRNVMIYFGQHLQKKLVPMFHYALRPGGHLLLGAAENFSLFSDLFRTMKNKARIAQRKSVSVPAVEATALIAGQASKAASRQAIPAEEAELGAISQRIVMDEFAPSYAVVDEDGQVVFLAAGAERYLQPPTGHFSNNIVRMARSGLRSPLRSLWSQASRRKRTVTRDGVVLSTPEGKERVRLVIQPMPELGRDQGLYMLVFQHQGAVVQELKTEGVSAEAEYQIEQLEADLVRTREELEHTVQDLEAANEEMKASNEELISINEELHAANEELETSKEEIQGANAALGDVNNDLRNLLRSMRLATIFLDADGGIRSFTPITSELFNLTPSDVGRPIHHFTHRFEYLPPLPSADALSSAEVLVEQEVRHEDGRWFLRRVAPYESSNSDAFEGWIITFVDITPQKAMQSRLAEAEREAQQRLAEVNTIYRTAPVGLALLDTDLRFQRINELLASINGLPPSKHIGRTPFEIVPELAKKAEPYLREVLDKGHAVGPFEVTGKRPAANGDENIWLEVYYVPVHDSQQRVIGVSAAAQDITERRRSEAEIRASASRLTKVLDGLAALAGLLELDGTLIEANQTALDLADLQRSDVIGKKFWDTYWWRHDRKVQSGLKKAIRQAAAGKFVRYDVDVRVDDDHLVTIDFQLSPLIDDEGRITHLVPSAMDITKRKEAEQELLMREARYRTLFEQAAVGIAKVGLDGRWIRVNERLCEMLGYTQEELLKLTFNDVTFPEDRDKGVDALRKLRAGEIERYSIEKRYVRKAGDAFWCNLTTVLHHSDDDDQEFLISVVEDIDARKKALETQDMLIHELNHRVRNTLTVVKSIAAQTRRHSDGLDSFGEAFDGRIQALAATHTLLAEGRWQRSQLKGLIERQVHSHTTRVDAFDMSGPDVAFGPKAALSLSLVFHELATNAAKYGALAGAEGRIVVRWAITRREGRRMLDLTWKECGGPSVTPPTRTGFGSKLIEFNIVHEFEGRVDRDFQPDGLICTLSMTLSEEA